MRTNKVGSRPTKNWVHIWLEKKGIEERVLKYFQVENGNQHTPIFSCLTRHKFSLKVMWPACVYFLLNY